MHRKPEPKAAAQLLAQAFAAQGVELKHQAALNLLATLEGFESYAHMKAAREPEVAKAPEEYVVHLVFSEEDVRNLNEARDADDDEAFEEVLREEGRTFKFPSPALMQAFLDGVEEGCGWLEYENVTSEFNNLPGLVTRVPPVVFGLHGHE
jgi:hypothetical protein